jgi:hypothetical protein
MREIFEAISEYAKAYKLLEEVQRSRPMHLPRGDQKTGVIAEFYGRLYATARFAPTELKFGSTSQHAWDIKVPQPGLEALKIQIKAVSAHAQKGRISTIHPGWDELWLMHLTEEMLPQAFWIYTKEDSPWATKTLLTKTMPRRGISNSGSAELRNGTDRLPELLATILTANPSCSEQDSYGLQYKIVAESVR